LKIANARGLKNRVQANVRLQVLKGPVSESNPEQGRSGHERREVFARNRAACTHADAKLAGEWLGVNSPGEAENQHCCSAGFDHIRLDVSAVLRVSDESNIAMTRITPPILLRRLRK
jgi:hypothetical protein